METRNCSSRILWQYTCLFSLLCHAHAIPPLILTQFSLLNLVGGNTCPVINQCQRAQRKYLKGLRKLKFLPGCEVLTCSSSRSTSPTITMLMFPPIVPSLKRLDTWRRHKEMFVHEGIKDWMRIELLFPDPHYHHHFHYSNNILNLMFLCATFASTQNITQNTISEVCESRQVGQGGGCF